MQIDRNSKILITLIIIMIIAIGTLLMPKEGQRLCLYQIDLTQALQDDYEVDINCIEQYYGLSE
jgi:hypothetical protein